MSAIAMLLSASPASAIISGGGSLTDGIPSLVYNSLDGSVWIETGAAFGGPANLYNISLESYEAIFSPIHATSAVSFALDSIIVTQANQPIPDGTLLGDPGFMYNGEAESFLLDDLTFIFQLSPSGTPFTSDLVYFTGIVEDIDGDLDSDGFVGINDLNIILGVWNQNVPPADARADPSGDGFVGIDDLNTVLGNWNAGTPPAAAVPEPATAACIALLLGAGIARRNRQ